MKCRVCGAESGKYLLCQNCNERRKTGEVVKCKVCGRWHDAADACHEEKEFRLEQENHSKEEKEEMEVSMPSLETADMVFDSKQEEPFLYQLKTSLMTVTEKQYFQCIQGCLPENCRICPQANLATFIRRTDGAKYQNELYRNMDFLITDLEYKPLIVVEINDKSHLTYERKKRDQKIAKICEEAGIPLLRFWTSYGVNEPYIRERIKYALNSLPVQRIHHFGPQNNAKKPEQSAMAAPTAEKGCYIATCVYGSYDCPEVWVLRRFRDSVLMHRWYGRLAVHCYYLISPFLVRNWGRSKGFLFFWRAILNRLVSALKTEGMDDSPYTD